MTMLVTAFGYGGHDDTEANILESCSSDYGLTWSAEHYRAWPGRNRASQRDRPRVLLENEPTSDRRHRRS